MIELAFYALPLLLVLIPLLAGRYPGAGVLAGPRRPRPRPARSAGAVAAPRTPRLGLPRGGALLAASLAKRGPPAPLAVN